MSLLVIFEILGLVVNTLAADWIYSLENKENLLQEIQMQLSKELKVFLNFLLRFWNVH